MYKLHKPSIGGMVTAIKPQKWASFLLKVFMLWCKPSLVLLIARDAEQGTKTACFFFLQILYIFQAVLYVLSALRVWSAVH